MLFTSLPFAAFLAITFLLYYWKPLRQFQVWLLVVASLIFYSWQTPALVFLVIASVLINAYTTFRVGLSDPKGARKWAAAGVIVNLAVLAAFKYGGLLSTTLQHVLLGKVAWPLYIPLPIGISFYTFEGISLLADTFRLRDKDPATFVRGDFQIDRRFGRHLRNTALFIAFFPHLIAGPILKARHFFPQISTKYFRDIEWETAIRSLIVGFFLKTVVADNLKDYTFWIAYPAYESLSGKTALVLLFGYSFQIFADFAGYSLIAIGLGYMFGYELPINFNFPYISKSFSEFWRRWHISLSTWLRDYLYFPLGGNRKGNGRTYINLMTVMIVGGFWHGAAWSYMVWGGYHGILLALERLILGDKAVASDMPSKNLKEHVVNAARVTFVFVMVTFGWLLFKLPDFGEAVGYLKIMATHWKGSLDMTRALPVFVYSFPLIVYYWWNLPKVLEWRAKSAEKPLGVFRWLEAIGYAFAIFAICTNGGSSGEFIYFQF